MCKLWDKLFGSAFLHVFRLISLDLDTIERRRLIYDLVFTALHGMQRGLTMRFLSVRPSVCLSVRRVDCDKTKEKSVQIFIPRERAFTLVF